MSVLLADIDATCAALGYSDGQRYQAEPDAIQCLKHLIWILRRDLDNHEYRRHLGRSKVLQTDLVYMLPDYVEDDEYADVLIRLLVILTNPTLLLYRDGPPKDNHGRKVFLELIDILQGYKSAFTRDKTWAALFNRLQKALEIDWALRSEEQNLLIERILVLIRNVLQVPANPEAECRADNDASVHDQVIWALHQSGILDLVLYVISSPDEHQFHLHGLEILCLLYREQTAESLADASLQRSTTEKQRDEQELLAARRREKQRLLSKPSTGRHSRFGGTYVIRNMKSISDRDIICHQPLERVMAMDLDREKEQQRRSHRHVKEEARVTRRSAFSVRLCLREYCIEVLRSAYNTLVRQVRRVLERNSGSTSHDDSYLLWAMRFFMEFNRLSEPQLQLVSESLSVQCFHWVLTRMQHDMDMIVSDKKQARLWAKRLHVALLTFRELLQSLLALQRLQDDNARALFDMLLNNVCYVLEYRETILHLLMNYNEAHSTKAYLRDVVETANIFIKMMEKFCKDSVVLQDRKRSKKRAAPKKPKPPKKTPQEAEEELADKWAETADLLSNLLTNELTIPEEEQPIPFDAAAEKSIDDQKEDCMIRIHRLLREQKLDQAIALMRAGREVWPENDVFGAMSAAPEDELLLLREIFMHNITTVEEPEVENQLDEDEDDEEEDEIDEPDVVEKTFRFEDLAKRLLNPKIVRACTVVLSDWEQIPTKSLKAAVTILHRIAYGCSCPAMLYQANLFRIFQQVLHTARGAHQEELRRLAIFVIRKFVQTAPTNPKIYAELLFYKSVREANELESGYCDAYDTGTKGAWSEEQETELRCLFEENQSNPATDKDVIDWILDNLIDKTRTRRGVLKKLKELGLMFKAPTKKSSTALAKHLWRSEEDEELRSLFDQHRMEDDCLQRILDEFGERRNKQQIIKRLLQLHMIADKSEILPQKPRKRNPKKKQQNSDESDDDGMEEPSFKPASSKPSNAKKPPKAPKRKIMRTPLDVGTLKALLAQIDSEKYQQAIDWLKECLEDAAEDTEEAAEEDDGVPLVPLLEAQRTAFEDKDFQSLLVALGIQPPIVGIENYWRIPIYLNAADLKLRAKIVGGEEVDFDVNGLEDDAQQGEDSVEESNNVASGEESEEDFFDGYLARQRSANFVEQQREKLNSLLFNKSDDEGEGHLLQKKKPKRKQLQQQEDSEEDENELVDEISQKLLKKKRQPDLTSDEEEDVFTQIKEGRETQKDQPTTSTKKSTEATALNGKPNKAKRQAKKKREASDSEPELVDEISRKLLKKKRQPGYSSEEEEDIFSKIPEDKPRKGEMLSAEAIFEQLKAKRASKAKTAHEPVEPTNSQEVDELDFNSEDYRKRLAELGDSDNEEDDNVEANPGAKNRTRRRNVIDSDSDEPENENEKRPGTQTDKECVAAVVNKDVADKTSNQARMGAANGSGNGNLSGESEDDVATGSGGGKKRVRSEESDLELVKNGTDTENEDAFFISRRKATQEERAAIASGEEPAKRRRVAVIKDDEDDD